MIVLPSPRAVKPSSAFSPLDLSPALWLKSDAGAYSDCARQFVAASSQRLTLTNGISAMRGASTLTIAAWMKRTASNSTVFVGSGSSNSNRTGILLFSDGNIYGLANNGSNTFASIASSGTNWTYVVLVFDGAGATNADKLKLYVNGSIVSPTYSGTIGTTTSSTVLDLYLGYYQAGTTYSNGLLDSVGVWSDAKNSTFVTSMYNSGNGKTYADMSASEKTNIISFWNLSEASGTAYDSAASNNLTADNNPLGADGIVAGLASANSVVTTWQDQSGNNRNMTQSTIASCPTFLTSQLNGYPGLTFATDDFMANAVYDWETLTAVTFYVVHIPQISSAAETSYGCLLSFSEPGSSTAYTFFGGTSSALTNETWTFGAESALPLSARLGTSTTDYSFTSGTAEYDTMQSGSGGTTLFKNSSAITISLSSGGSTASNYAPSTLSMSTSTALTLGALRIATTSLYLNSKVVEVILYPAYHNSTQRGQVQAYLAARYGL